MLFLESDRGKKGNKTFYIAVGIIILVLLSLYTLFMMWIGGGYLEEGLAGYISHTVKMTGLAVALGALLWILFLCIYLLLCIYLFRNIILDIPYISRPECTRLEAVSWDVDTEMEHYTPYKIEGLDEDGKKQRFTVNKSTYKKYRREYSINTADVMYLPHTRIVMELDMGRLSLQ